MAVSSSFSKAFGPQNRYKLLIEWKAEPDITGNKSTITAKAYLDTEKYGTMYASAQKTGSISIDGQSGGISKTGISNDGNEKTFLGEITKTVTHNSDGSKSLTLSAYFDFEVRISGDWVGRVTASDEITLNTIPRASSLSAGQNFTAGGNISASVSRASSKFRHELEYAVKNKAGEWEWILQIALSNTKTSSNYAPSVAEKTRIFRILDGRASAPVRVILQTFNGNNEIGSKEYTNGTVKAPAASTITFPASFNVGTTITGKITRNNADFVHDIHLIDGTAKEAQVATNAETAYSWGTSALYSDMSTVKSKTYKLRVFTKYNGVQVQDPRDYTVTAKITDSNPTFPGAFSYKDTNPATVDITKDNQKIIQGLSKVTVTIPAASKATAKNGATMSKYVVTVNGVEKSANYSTSDINIDYGIITAAANVAITVKAVDSRGNSVSSSKTVTILPYKAPVITFTAERVNGFEDATNIKVNGTYSQLLIGGVAQNGPSTISAKFAIQERPNKGYGSYANLTLTVANGKISGSTQIVLSKDNAYDIQLILADKFNSTNYVALIGKGRPILHIDSVLDALGFNIFPTEAGTFLIDGKVIFAPNRYAKDAAIDANNGDLIGLNGLYFNDKADNDGEGFLFLKTGKPEKSLNKEDYDNFRILDGIAYLNNKPVLRDPNKGNSLWNGAYLMKDNQTVTPNKPLDQCANGWILVWSDNEGGSTEKPGDFNYVPTYIHKSHVDFYSGKNTFLPVGASTSVVVSKTVHITNANIRGNNDNIGGYLEDVILVRVLEW